MLSVGDKMHGSEDGEAFGPHAFDMGSVEESRVLPDPQPVERVRGFDSKGEEEAHSPAIPSGRNGTVGSSLQRFRKSQRPPHSVSPISRCSEPSRSTA